MCYFASLFNLYLCKDATVFTHLILINFKELKYTKCKNVLINVMQYNTMNHIFTVIKHIFYLTLFMSI